MKIGVLLHIYKGGVRLRGGEGGGDGGELGRYDLEFWNNQIQNQKAPPRRGGGDRGWEVMIRLGKQNWLLRDKLDLR